MDEVSRQICRGLGGKKNISDVDCCATRLRCTVFDPALVNDDVLKSTGASGTAPDEEWISEDLTKENYCFLTDDSKEYKAASLIRQLLWQTDN